MHLSINIASNIEPDDHSGPFLYNIDLLYLLYSNLKIEDGHYQICMTNYNWFVSFLCMHGGYLKFLIVWWCRTYFATLLWKLNLQGRWLRMMILMTLLVVVFQRYAKKMQLFNTGSKRTLIRPLDVKEYRFLQKTRH